MTRDFLWRAEGGYSSRRHEEGSPCMSLARRWWWRLLVGAAAVATTCFFLLGIQHPDPGSRQERDDLFHLHRDGHGRKNNYTILLWTSFYGDWHYLHSDQNGGCSVSCDVTSDKSLIRDARALVFHVRDMSLVSLPNFRSPEQRWIFYCLESPEYSYFTGFHHMNGMFNWTMTYRRDSDVVIPYGFVKRKKKNSLVSTSTELHPLDLSMKNKLTFWLVSHCKTAGLREDYVAELAKWTKVDIYGKCGTVSCKRDQGNLCFQELSNHYKFVLAFENSLCKDYATEKFYKALRYNVVPIVFGGANYAKIAPPNSYIDALSFSSPKHLAEYLEMVDSNATLYESFLDWKRDYRVELLMSQTLCTLCHKLHDSTHVASFYSDMYKWWVDAGECRKWTNK